MILSVHRLPTYRAYLPVQDDFHPIDLPQRPCVSRAGFIPLQAVAPALYIRKIVTAREDSSFRHVAHIEPSRLSLAVHPRLPVCRLDNQR